MIEEAKDAVGGACISVARSSSSVLRVKANSQPFGPREREH